MRILLATDGSRYARAAARFLARFVSGPGKHVDVITIVPHEARDCRVSHGRSKALTAQWRATGIARVDMTAGILEDHGFVVDRLMRCGDAAAGVVEQVIREPYDLVVAGARGRGVAPCFAPGSVALAILERVPTSILLVREREALKRGQVMKATRPLRVLVATDGEPHSDDAIDRFMDLVREPGMLITVASVLDQARQPATVAAGGSAESNGLEHEARARVNLAMHRLTPMTAVLLPAVLEGRVAEALNAKAAESQVHLIVAGSAGYPGDPSSVAARVARAAPCSVLIVRSSSVA